MELTQQQLIFFSPTRTTQKILSAIAEGTGLEMTGQVNLTRPAAETADITEFNHELAIIGAPVYAGRVALKAVDRLKTVKGNATPAVITVVYGNREFEDALIELHDIAVAAGFIPVAAAAFIGEHSFSTDEKPIATNRPDASDLATAREFGKSVIEKLSGLQTLETDVPLTVPGNSSYKERSVRTGVSPQSDSDSCTLCGTCAEVCPTGAISVTDKVETDVDKCIICCACVKDCPTGTRTLDDDGIRKVREWLSTSFSIRRDPEIFV